MALFALVVWATCVAAEPERRKVLDLGGREIEVVIEAGALDLSRDEVFGWVEAQSRAVGAYFGRFPVERARVRVRPVSGARTGGGVMYAGDPPRVQINVGAGCTLSVLERSWVLTHELTHLALPDQRDEHRWLEEGLATYVEPWVRVQQGQITAEQVWRELVEGLPKGLPGPGDRGLDHTHTWGRTYWGGALFFFLADLEIRRRTSDERGIRDALRGVTAAGLDAATKGSIADVLATGDTAVGHGVLAAQYAAMKDAPYSVDLDAIWRDLGVRLEGGTITYDDTAPRASTRRAMSAL